MSILFSRVGDGIDRLVEFTGDLASPFLEVFDAIMSVIVAALGLFLVIMHEFSLGLLTYTPYPGESEENSSQYIFGTPEEGDIFYTIITFNNNFIEPFALLMVFTGIIFLLFLRVFDIVIDDIGINTQEGMKRLFIAPIMIVLWIPIANLILYFAFGMTEWLTSLTLPGMEEIMQDDSAVDYDTDEDGSGSELGVMSYVELFERDEDAALGVFTSLLFIMYGAAAILVSAIIYLFVMIGAFLRVLGVFGFYALAPIGIVLWSFKWRDFAKIGGTIIRYFILLAIFPIGVAFINLMSPPLLMAVQLASEDIIAEITDFTWNNPVHEGSINMTDVISNEEVMGVAFIIMTPILVGIIPWGIVIGFDKAIKMGVGAAGVAGAGALALGTGGLGAAGLGLANADNIAKAGASAAGSAKNRAIRAGADMREKMTKENAYSFGNDMKSGAFNKAKRYGTMTGLKNRVKGTESYLKSKGRGAVEMKDSWINKRDNMNESLFGAKDRLSNAVEKTNRTEMEKAFADSSFVSKRLKHTKLGFMQDAAKAHLKGEDFLHSQLARTELAKDEREHNEGGLFTDSVDGELIDEDGNINEEHLENMDEADAVEEFTKMHEEKALASELAEDDDLKKQYMDYKYRESIRRDDMSAIKAFSPEKRDDHLDDVNNDEMVHTFMSALQPDSDMEPEDVFGVTGAQEAKDIFKNLDTSKVESQMINSDNHAHRQFKTNHAEEIQEIFNEKYGDDANDTLLEREYRKALYDKSEQYISSMDKTVSESVAEASSVAIGEDDDIFADAVRESIGDPEDSGYAEERQNAVSTMVKDIIEKGGDKEAIKESAESSFGKVNGDLSESEIDDLYNSFQTAVADSVDASDNTIKVDTKDLGAKYTADELDNIDDVVGLVIDEAVNASNNRTGISVDGSDLKGQAQNNAATRLKAIEKALEKEAEESVGAVVSLLEQSQIERGRTAMESVDAFTNEIVDEIKDAGGKIDVESEVSSIDDLIPDDIPAERRKEIEAKTEELSDNLEQVVQNAANRTGGDVTVDYDSDNTAQAIVDVFGKKLHTLNEEQVSHIEKAMDNNVRQVRDEVSDAIEHHVNDYYKSEESLNDYISTIEDDTQRREFADELYRRYG